jgi:phosphohistidine phosphatase
VPVLHLIRHAKSSWDDPALADEQRPLARRGIRDAGRMADHLAEVELRPQLVLCSSAVRAQQTLDLLRPALGGATVHVEPDLYAAGADELLGRLQSVPAACASVLAVGHNPGFHDLAVKLVGTGSQRDRLAAKFPTCALASLELTDGGWADLGAGGAALVRYVTPRDLRREHGT